jgi:thiol-disulfide isomerase/thioredoxin
MGDHGGRDRLISMAGDQPIVDLPEGSPLRGAGRPTLVVLLRSFGCTFCREAMADVAALKQQIRDAGIDIAFVHVEPAREAAPWLKKYGLADVMSISDPDLAHYKAFGLGQPPATAFVSPAVWARGAVSALSHGFGVQTPAQLRIMPGVFLMQHDRVMAEYRHRTPADRPDYIALLRAANRANAALQ